MNTNPFKTYTSPKGREYKVIQVAKVPDTEKWIGKVEKYHWVITIRYQDNSEKMKLFYDYNDKLYKTETPTLNKE